MSDSLSPALQEQMRLLSDGYAQKLPGKVAQILLLWRSVRDDASSLWAPDTLSNLHRLVHSLAGSGTTFGFSEVSRHARRAEIVLKPLALAGASPNASQKQDIEAALFELEQIAAHPLEFQTAALELEGSGRRDKRDLVLLTDNPEGIKSWAPALEAFGYSLRICVSAQAFRTAMQRPVAALVVDCSVLPMQMMVDGEPLPALLAGMGAGTGFPLVWTGRSGDLRARLQAVRLGGAAYLPQPVDVDALVGKLDTLTNTQSPDPFRVLIVDDEASLTRLFSLILRQAGMETREVTEPLDIMEPLLEFRPDLILMDVFMPSCKGTELAAILRQQDAYFNTPIVFLSVETDTFLQQQALRQGGDDFLSKPIEPRNLVSAVTLRAARARALRHLVSHDAVTGLLNHTRLREQLEIEVARAMRLEQNISFALVDIDHFKAINDRYGFAAGDRVLRALSRMLGGHLRQTDVIGRYGGEEFAVILTGAKAGQAARRLDEVRSAFGALNHVAGGEEFKVTFSCGIASAPPNGESLGLSETAEAALKQAKDAGRNRVVTAQT
jgi:diguanylate cyclase (GGDEF)-like protein